MTSAMLAALNLVLFEPQELNTPLPRSDRRVKHVLSVLRRGVGDSFDAGIVNGARGKATVAAIASDTLTFTFQATESVTAAAPITLVIGLPRPQTARDILRDATTLGVAAIHFVRTQKAEASYAQSSLWTLGEWQRHAFAGAEQAFDTHVPEITFDRTLTEVLAAGAVTPTGNDAEWRFVKSSQPPLRIALDNYESAHALSAHPIDRNSHVVLAIGAERGWSTAERDALRQAGFTLAHLGTRVLRTETAIVAALSIVRAKLGLM